MAVRRAKECCDGHCAPDYPGESAHTLGLTHVDDGSWQFLIGGEFSAADAMLIALDEIVRHHSSACELEDSPLVWGTARGSAGCPGRRSRHADTG